MCKWWDFAVQVQRRKGVRVLFSPPAAARDAAEFAALARQLAPDLVARGTALGAANAAWHWYVFIATIQGFWCLKFATLARQLVPDLVARGTATGATDAAWRWTPFTHTLHKCLPMLVLHECLLCACCLCEEAG